MAKITYPHKNTGDDFFAAETNEIKSVVNGIDDKNISQDSELTSLDSRVSQLRTDVDANPSTSSYYNDVSYNVGAIGEFMSKLHNKVVDENNELTVVMTGDSIFGRLHEPDGVTNHVGYEARHFPPNFPQMLIGAKLLESLQFPGADVKYYNLDAAEWTKTGTWTRSTHIDRVWVWINDGSNAESFEITVTGAKFFKVTFSTYGNYSNGIGVLINGQLPSTIAGVVGEDNISYGSSGKEVKWANRIWSGLDEATSYTFKFTTVEGNRSAIWGCEIWSHPKLNVVNSGHGGFRATNHIEHTIDYPQNEYYKADLVIHELPILNDSGPFSGNFKGVVDPTSARVGGTTEHSTVECSIDGTYINFDNVVAKAGVYMAIGADGKYSLDTPLYDSERDNLLDDTNEYLSNYISSDYPLITFTSHRPSWYQGRPYMMKWLKGQRMIVGSKGIAFTDLWAKCVNENITGILSDGTHLNNAGMQLWHDVIMETLGSSLEVKRATGAPEQAYESGLISLSSATTIPFKNYYKNPPDVQLTPVTKAVFISEVKNNRILTTTDGDMYWTITKLNK